MSIPVGRGRLHARLADALERGEIGRDGRISRRQQLGQMPRQTGSRLTVGNPVVDEGPLGSALQHLSVDQQPQVPADARLALPDDLGDLSHGQLDLAEQRHQP